MGEPVVLLKYKDNFSESLDKSLELLGGFGVLESPIMIKPNICTNIDRTGCANVNIEVIKALIKQILQRDNGLSVKIVESDSMSKDADEAYEKFGYTEYVENKSKQGFDISLINLSKAPTTKIDFNGLYFNNPILPKILTETKYTISVALAKTHSLSLITGAMKNLFGLLPRKEQRYYHPDINNVIIDLNTLIRSNLCLIDARVGLEGVTTGTPKQVGALILGKNPVSVDATMARVMGFNPKQIFHLVKAETIGLGTLNPEIIGDPIDSIKVKFETPSNLKQSALIK
jgi:uncharacterized protein (DUF362 family)